MSTFIDDFKKGYKKGEKDGFVKTYRQFEGRPVISFFHKSFMLSVIAGQAVVVWYCVETVFTFIGNVF